MAHLVHKSGAVGKLITIGRVNVGFWVPGLLNGGAQVSLDRADCTLRIISKLNAYKWN